MTVTVKLFATLRAYRPSEPGRNSFPMGVAAGSTVGGLLAELSIPADMPLIIFVNAAHTERDYALKDGDVLSVFPPIAGG